MENQQTIRTAFPEVVVVGIPGGAIKWVKQALRLPQRRIRGNLSFTFFEPRKISDFRFF